MYQSIYFDRTTYEYHLRDDVKGWKTFKYQPTLYQLDPDGEFETLDGQSVSPVKKMDDWKDPKYFEKDVDKDTRVLVDFYYQSDETPSYHNLVYLDIECEIAGALTPENIKDPKGKITSVALYDNNSKKYYCLILDEQQLMSEAKTESKEVIPYKTEKELLNGFLDLWIKLDPTIISGWNSEFFDMPYLYHRINKVLGNDMGNYLSPIQKVNISNMTTKDGFEEFLNIGGVNHLDYMNLFKKFITKQEPSYALGNIGEKYVKLGKIDYHGSLDRLFAEDVDKFIEYNIRDVEIIVELEKSLKFIDLTVTIAHLCHTKYDTIYYSTILNDGAILTYLKRKGIVSPNKPTTYNPSLRTLQEEYAGGYLKDPTPGLYEWVIDLDFTSLYPSIIRSLNMGIETLIGRVVNKDKFDNQWSLKELKAMDPNKTVTIEKVKKDRRLSEAQISVGELIKIIEKNDFIISAPGVIFRKDKLSVVCEILSDWFDKRQEYKALMKKAYKVDNDPVMGEFYNKRQHAYKIKLNDVYGVFAINGWRYTDGHKFISKAITLTGQRLLQESIANMNTYLNNELSNETPVDYIVTSDTDSLFIQCKDLLKARHPDIDFSNQEDVIKKILVIANELQAMANKFIGEFARDAFNLGEDAQHYFELKQEVVLDRGYFAGKRRYAQHIVNKEGVRAPAISHSISK